MHRASAVTAFLFLFASACADEPTSVGGIEVPPSPALAVADNTPAAFVSQLNTNMCLAVRGSIAAGSPTELRTCDGSANQQFVITGNEIRINGNLCVDASGGGGANGDAIIVWPCLTYQNQRWTLNSDNTIRGIGGKCIDVAEGRAVAGQRIILWSCHGSTNQRWTRQVFASPPPSDDPTDTTTTPPPPPPTGALAVVPGLYGFGTATPAGRGGQVLRVTNLNDSGVGSLRAALTASGPRTVVCEVSGTIALGSNISIGSPNLTFAGQTCPAPGLVLTRYGIRVNTHDVLIQHLRIRPGDAGAPGQNASLLVLGGAYNVVVDHVSASWGVDENFSAYITSAAPRDVTFSNLIVAEGLNHSIAAPGEEGKAFLIGERTKNIAMLGNLTASNQDRHPYLKGDNTSIFANNVVYNWGGYQASYLGDPDNAGPQQATIVGNVYVRGPSTRPGRPIQVFADVKAGSRLYVRDNSDGRGAAPPSDPWSLVRNDEGAGVVASSPPVWPAGFVAMPNAQVYAAVLAGAGAWPASRDAVDLRVVASVRAGTGAMISSQNQVGGYPSIPATTRAVALPANPNGDDDRDGYTNLEEWLHGLARAAEGR